MITGEIKSTLQRRFAAIVDSIERPDPPACAFGQAGHPVRRAAGPGFQEEL
jgi:hypothetical protein